VERCTNHCAIATKRCAPWLRVKSSPGTAELDRRDQVTATVPGPVPFERGEQRSIIR
jgi:hypothetical protein